ncbi:MAG: bifunctional oligoribonuclease/PAP phosphatase NrnA [Candidatus Edwardsbacteria bacterium]|nr:bifunctional oligoribonuclease/PAP phosphatase NrnA [Candidatus Edwardsbacteria bacterium]MBU1575875.1 bifunctional oligoribonuclease/PAP phosphatase NrnA [Candidatus Edwardsbacteria bacterium]MBU2464353.1 bifunctional oligoribonuclease/PAP phosphatase NrnA [Candidatus Edwardsbacteria bacterium]MBU2593089.1 bifunctional oligoribonuclease/PAP phosphatase NrnA [Candidatus Edwardsbacteria bacterium]
MTASEIAQALEKHRRIMITSHVNPDGDSISSQLALASLLKSLGKQVSTINQDPVPERYRFLPGWESISNKMETPNVTAVCVVDCANPQRLGQAAELITPATMELIVIDHHVSNDGFGHIQYIDTQASSTCELVYRISQKLGVKLSAEQATILLSGIMTDSGGFRYSNTSPVTLRSAALLMESGAELAWISEQLYFQQPLRHLKVLGQLFSDLKTAANGRISWVALTQEIARKHGLDINDSEEFVSHVLAVKGAEVGLLFKEQGNGIVRVSFRSKGRVDVNRLAAIFEGGGHLQAAGARVRGSIDEVTRKVIETVEREI